MQEIEINPHFKLQDGTIIDGCTISIIDFDWNSLREIAPCIFMVKQRKERD